MNLLELVEELEDLTETSSQIPLTGKVMIDRDELLEIINEMRNEIPTEVREAKQISTDRDTIIKKKKKEADNIIQGARSHAEEIISQDELVLQANKRADEILKSSMPINWEKTYKDREELRKMFEKFITKAN